MKIAMTSYYLPSVSKIGAGYQAHYMANELVKRGHDVTVFTPATHPADALYKTHQVDVGKRLRTFRYALEVRRIDFSGFDVFNAYGDDYWLGGKKRPPHIRTMTGSCLAEAFNIRGSKEKLRMFALYMGEVLATFVADRTICISKNTRRHFPWTKDVIPCGVDTSVFHPRNNKSANPSILFVGTMHSRKRGNLLMDIFQNQIKPQIPEAELWIVREETPQTGDGIKWFGHLSTDELADLFSSAWVFCLPSTYEGFGVPYIEAMSAGTAVVASPNVGAREVLDEGKYGIVCKDSHLASSLLGLLQDEHRRKQYESLGLQRAEVFSWSTVLARYEEIYRETAAKKGLTLA